MHVIQSVKGGLKRTEHVVPYAGRYKGLQALLRDGFASSYAFAAIAAATLAFRYRARLVKVIKLGSDNWRILLALLRLLRFQHGRWKDLGSH
jgi:hypothetical protein